ncbi:unnamed protein product, partial [Polarella glacialis]
LRPSSCEKQGPALWPRREVQLRGLCRIPLVSAAGVNAGLLAGTVAGRTLVNSKNNSKTSNNQQKEKTAGGEMLLEPTVCAWATRARSTP